MPRSSSVRRAALAALALSLLAGCSSGEQTVEGPVTVYVSLPLTGPRAEEGNAAADGARRALEDAGGKAGDLEVSAEFLDDASPGAAWDPVAVGQNARAAAQDSSTAAYIGELDSEPTRASLPITNQAGIVQISPAAGGVDLTRPAAGYPDAPDRYRPSGDATFVRLAAADDEVADSAVEAAVDQGQSIRIEAPDSLYGDLMAERMTREAEAKGLAVDPEGGAEVTISVDPVGPVVVAGPAGRRPVTGLRGSFEEQGYEAMQLALQGIEEAEGRGEFRPAVRDAIFGATRAGSGLGPYTVGEDGDSQPG